MFRKSIFSMVVIFILGGITFSLVQKDVQGSKDHPVISRYQGSYIIGYEQEGYDQLVLFLGSYDGDVTKTITPDGKVTRILYAGPRGRSSLEVQQNYRLALQDASFEILYECSEDCQRLPDFFYGGEQKLENRGDLSRYSISYDRSQDQRYLLARFSRPGVMYAAVFTVLSTGNYYGKEDKEEIQNRPVTLLQIVDKTAMETGKVEVHADEMAATLSKTGKVS